MRRKKINSVILAVAAAFLLMCCCTGFGACAGSPGGSVPAPSPTASAEPEEVGLPDEPEPDESDEAVYYPNCAAVRAAGAAPLHAGEPGYRKGLDRDGDGTACDR